MFSFFIILLINIDSIESFIGYKAPNFVLRFSNNEGSNVEHRSFRVKNARVQVDDRLKVKALLLCGGLSNRTKDSIDSYIPEGIPKCKQFLYINGIPLFVYSFVELIRNYYINEVVIVTRPEWFRVVKIMLLQSKEFIKDTINRKKTPLKSDEQRFKSSIEGYGNILIDTCTHLKYDLNTFEFTDSRYEDESSRSSNSKSVRLCKSGQERYNSVYNGLKSLEDYDGLVLIHDGARPLLSYLDLDRLIEMGVKHKAVVPGYRSVDTLKIVKPKTNAKQEFCGQTIGGFNEVTEDTADKQGYCNLAENSPNHLPDTPEDHVRDSQVPPVVKATVDRNSVYNIQTPQVFEYRLIKTAYDDVLSDGNELDFHLTDDSSFVERAGVVDVYVLDGHRLNVKLTTYEDVELCKFLLTNNYNLLN